jgi:hypothetical protein
MSDESQRNAKPNGPDFSGVESREKAEELFRQGVLEKLFLRPLEFGGEDHPLNSVYVPVGVAALKSGIDNNVIGPLAAEGKVTKYKATLEYQDNSLIPIAIKITASDPGDFSSTINIWGDALTREQDA